MLGVPNHPIKHVWFLPHAAHTSTPFCIIMQHDFAPCEFHYECVSQHFTVMPVWVMRWHSRRGEWGNLLYLQLSENSWQGNWSRSCSRADVHGHWATISPPAVSLSLSSLPSLLVFMAKFNTNIYIYILMPLRSSLSINPSLSFNHCMLGSIPVVRGGGNTPWLQVLCAAHTTFSHTLIFRAI